MLIAFIALAFTACQKPEDDNLTPPPAVAPSISKIIYGQQSVEYIYNADGTRREEIIRNNGGTQVGKYEYVYENGKLKESRSGNIRLQYSYPNASTINVDLRGITGNINYSFEYKFAGNRLMEWVQYSTINGAKQPDHKVAHTYNHSGNIITSEHYEYINGVWTPYETVAIQYDNKINYTSHADNIGHYLGANRILTNNPVKEEYRTSNGSFFKTVTYQNTYDASGKKIKTVKRTTEDGLADETETILFEY